MSRAFPTHISIILLPIFALSIEMYTWLDVHQ